MDTSKILKDYSGFILDRGPDMQSILSCISESHDNRLLALAALVCVVGVYSASTVSYHAGRGDRTHRTLWAAVSIMAAGCTAWATHMIGLLAFQPGMQSGFEPIPVAVSLFLGTLGIGAGVALAVGTRHKGRRFVAGLVLGGGVVTLHYLGQMSYVVTGYVVWNIQLVALSIVLSLLLFGGSMVMFGARHLQMRQLGAPLLLAAIAVIHFGGLAATVLVFDPQRVLPEDALPPSIVAPIVAGVSLGLLGLAVFGFRSMQAAKARGRRDRQQLRALASVAVEGLAICDLDVIITSNQSLDDLSGHKPGDLAGKSLRSLLPGLNILHYPELEERDAELACAEGRFVPVRVLWRKVDVGAKQQIVVAVRDQRERLRTESAIRALAFSDHLTALPNRTRFTELLAAHAAACRERKTNFTVQMIDLDGFKLVNDTLGHATGDILLCMVADRLSEVVGNTSGLVARLGGDEFALLGIDVTDIASAEQLARQVVGTIGLPFEIKGQIINIGASVGVVFAPSHGVTPEELLRRADLALYKAKADGKSVCRIFDWKLEERAQRRRQTEADLRKALLNGEFELRYQPLVEPRTKRVTSVEALIRWHHPVLGMVPPNDFVSIAEDAGLINPIGRWVLRRACTDAVNWPSDVRVAVNLSPAQFRDPELVETVLDILQETGLPPHRLELEITEGVLLNEEQRTFETFGQLRQIGMILSMDDFGTGYSSLSYLRRFRFDKIKVDRSFVQNLPSDTESAAIVRAIVMLARALGMSVTVEGIETLEQYAFAEREGCDQVQGYFISRPLPLSDLNVMLNGERQHAA